jgi:hypothetical protein
MTLLVALAGAAAAQTEIERRRPASPKGAVSVENDFGTITVRGWDSNEVLVKGVLAAGAEGLSFEGEKGETWISVDVPDQWEQAAGEEAAFRSTLEVFVPAGAKLSVDSINAAVVIAAVGGRVEVSTVNGSVRVEAPASAVEVETMTGTVDVRARAAPMNIHSISGAVRLEGATGEVKVETVSGNVTVKGADIADLGIETTTGKVEVRGSLARRGEIGIETFSGPVGLTLPPTAKATFDLQTFSAQIRSQFCVGTPLTRRGFEPFRRLQCSTGSEEFEVTVRTHDADITLSQEANK